MIDPLLQFSSLSLKSLIVFLENIVSPLEFNDVVLIFESNLGEIHTPVVTDTSQLPQGSILSHHIVQGVLQLVEFLQQLYLFVLLGSELMSEFRDAIQSIGRLLVGSVHIQLVVQVLHSLGKLISRVLQMLLHVFHLLHSLVQHLVLVVGIFELLLLRLHLLVDLFGDALVEPLQLFLGKVKVLFVLVSLL